MLLLLGCGPPSGATDTGLQALTAHPDVLDFGVCDLGATRVAAVDLRNAGPEPVELDLWLGSTVFRLVEVPPRPVRLQPGDTWSLAVQFTPSDPTHEAELLARTAGAPEGLLVVPVVGEGRDPLTTP